VKSIDEEIKEVTEQLDLINAEMAAHNAELKWEVWDERSERDSTRKKFLELRVEYLKKATEPLNKKLQGKQEYKSWLRRVSHPQPLDVNGCPTCKHLACVCDIKNKHHVDCKFRRAATCDVPVACARHGRDTCSVCDPCTCPA
jgi:hypothetical protein